MSKPKRTTVVRPTFANANPIVGLGNGTADIAAYASQGPKSNFNRPFVITASAADLRLLADLIDEAQAKHDRLIEELSNK